MTDVAMPPPSPVSAMGPDQAVQLADRLFATVTAAVRGKDEVVRLSLVALLAAWALVPALGAVPYLDAAGLDPAGAGHQIATRLLPW